jgi:glutathione S-transferase
MQLVTIPFSHFCEKGRWALDRAGFEYRELQFAPVLHRLAVMPLGSVTSPVLVDAPRVIGGTNEIIEFADASLPESERLLPSDPARRAEVDALVERFDEHVAPDARLWLYSWATEDPKRLSDFTIDSMPRAQKPLVRKGAPVIAKALIDYFKIGPETHARSAERVSDELDFVSGLLADGREYLVGDSFTAADLAFAAFVGPILDIPSYGGKKYSSPPTPAGLAEQAATWSATPACKWVAGLYERHR